MTAARTSAQIAAGTGSALELIQLAGSSIYVPSTVARGIRESDGEIGDIKVSDLGEMKVRQTAADTLFSKDLVTTTATANGSFNGDPATALTGELIVSLAGKRSWAVRKSAGSATLVWEISMTGAIWDAVEMKRTDAQQNAAFQSVATTTLDSYEGSIPPGAMFGRVKATVVSGSVTVRIGVSEEARVSSVALSSPIPAGSNAIGSVALNGSANIVGATRRGTLWYDESSVLPTANQVITGGSRDVMGVANISQGNSFGEVFGAKGIYDQAHTLYVEESKAATTWFRTAKFAAVQVEAGGLWVSEINLRPSMRYYRGIIVMGPAAATTTASLTTKTI